MRVFGGEGVFGVGSAHIQLYVAHDHLALEQRNN